MVLKYNQALIFLEQEILSKLMTSMSRSDTKLKLIFLQSYSPAELIHSYWHLRLTWAGTLDWVNDGNSGETSTTSAPCLHHQPLTKFILCRTSIDITWASVEPDLWRHMVTLGHNELSCVLEDLIINAGSGNGLVPLGTKPLSDPVLTHIYNV